MASRRNIRNGVGKGWLGLALTALLGLTLLQPVGDSLARLSFDLPFLFASKKVPQDLALVYFDAQAKGRLGQPTNEPLPRQFYTQLLKKLTADGARLVLFDILFDVPDANPKVDEDFAAAIKENGRVVLVGDFLPQAQGNAFTTSVVPPIPVLARVAAGWGIARILPDKADLTIRVLDEGTSDTPSAGLAAACVARGEPAKATGDAVSERWLNYYCPPENLRSVNLDLALTEMTNGFFKNCAVVVGVRPSVGKAGAERERFPTPYTRFGTDASGPSIHAITYLNLRRGDWMKKVPIGVQRGLGIAWGIAVTLLLMSVRPWPAIGVSALCSAVFAIAAIYTQMRWHWWFNWMVPAVCQPSFALVWSVGYQYLVENNRRKMLRNAFGAYLSPYMADQIANSEFSLALGGQEVEVTVMFTDLEGFTKMSETLAPAEVSRILTSYFNETTRFILEQEGTIIKYIGDAVFAVWGAPLADARHAERAVRAACAMSRASQQEIEGRLLRTRIGLHTGLALAGNLGSDFRFDYTLIGDTVNFAARLEGLNKYLGTNVLISEATQRSAGTGIRTRFLGKFLVVGKSRPVGIYEALGPTDTTEDGAPWRKSFETGMHQFASREWEAAETSLRQTIKLRGGDGPSEFYLRELPRTRARVENDDTWDGSVLLESK